MSSSTSLRQPTVFAATIAVLAGALSTDASAAIVNYLSGAATQTDSPIVYFNTPPETTPGFQRQFFEGYNAFSSQAYRGQVAQASASLASGTLRAATQFSGGTGGNGGITLASAFIGDNFDFSLLALIIYQPGTLDDIVPFCGANVMYSFYWSVGQNSSHPCGGSFVGSLDGAVDQTVSATFNPGGDFAWALGFRLVNGVGGPLNSNTSWNYAFDNTIRYGFEAPEGATVTTTSGIAPGGETVTVPEPGTLALLGFGLASLGSPAP